MADNLPPQPPSPPPLRVPNEDNFSNSDQPTTPTDIGNLDLKEEKTGFKQKVKDFFSDRRKVVIALIILLLLLAALLAFFIFRRSENNVNNTPGQQGGSPQLPIEGEFVPDINPTVFRPGDGTVVVAWDTKTPSDGRVSYGLSTDYGYFADDQETLHPSLYSTWHTVVLRGLDFSQAYHLLASSLDGDGNIYYSKDIEVTPVVDNQPPIVTFLIPKSGETLSGVAKILPKSEDDQGIFSLAFYVDGQAQQVRRNKFNDNLALDTNLFNNGSHTLGLVVSDGANTARAEVVVNFENINTQNVTSNVALNISSPVPDQVLSAVKSAQASASDSTGKQITKIEYFIDGLKYGQANGSSATFEIDTTKLQDGRHTISFRATNSSGQSATKSQFFVVDNDSKQDSDGDGIPDSQDDNTSGGGRDDIDADGLPNSTDPDDDNDGIPDAQDDDDTGINVGSPNPSSIYINNINAQSGTNSITVTWQTNTETSSIIDWGSDLSYGQRVEAVTQTKNHSLIIINLQPDTLYYLKIGGLTASGQSVEPYQTFAKTLAVSGGGEGEGSGGGSGGEGNLPPGAPTGCESLDLSTKAAITAPKNDEFVQGDVEVVVSVESTKTTNQQVDFLINDTVFANDTTVPYSATLKTVTYVNGEYELKAVVKNSDGSCSDWGDFGPHVITVVIDNPALTFSNISPQLSDIYAFIRFKTSEPVNATIFYGTNKNNLTNSVITNTPVSAGNSYEALIKGLSPSTTYYFRVDVVNKTDPNRKAKSAVENFTTTSNPERQDMTASVSWQAPCSGVGTVYYDRYPKNNQLSSYTSSAYGGFATAAVTGGFSYTAVLTGLQSGVVYHYRYVTACSGNTITPPLNLDDLTFTTPSE